MYWAKKKKVIKSKVSWITTKSNRGYLILPMHAHAHTHTNTRMGIDKNLAKPIPY